MASCNLFDTRTTLLTVALLLLTSLPSFSLAAQRLPDHLSETPLRDGISYHGGAVLRGNIPVSILWYGQFSSLVGHHRHCLYLSNSTATSNNVTRVVVAGQVTDEHYSLGKSLKLAELSQLAAGLVVPKAKSDAALVLVLTDPDVVVESFCTARCGLHGSDSDAGYAYAWVGNAERQCPGQCAWPFAEPAYGPRGQPPLVPPNGNVGVDGMVVTLATMVAGAVLLNETTGGGSYNAVRANGRKYLLPAVYDPATSACSTLV
nr:unnamed protein product [Digitaria exilis]